MGSEQTLGAAVQVLRASAVPGLVSCASLRCSLRYRAQYSGHSHQIRRSHRELEVQIDAPDPSVHGLAQAPDRLCPTEVLLDALTNHLADRVARMPGRAPVDRAAALTCSVGRHVRTARPSLPVAHETETPPKRGVGECR